MTLYRTLSQSYSSSFFIYKIAICIYRFIFEVLRGTYSGFIFEIYFETLVLTMRFLSMSCTLSTISRSYSANL